jgi:folate-binding protein YgfZ
MALVKHADPLKPVHEQFPAEFQPYADVEIVSTFGNTPAEYSALHRGVGKMDMPQRGVLEVGGRDRLDFLNRLLTNQIQDRQTKAPLPPGSGIYAFLLNDKGRIAADMNVLETGECAYLEMDKRLLEPTRAALEKYLIIDDVKLINRDGELHEIAILGPEAGAQLGAADLTVAGSRKMTLAGAAVTVFRDDPCGTPGFFILVPVESAAAVWESLPCRPIGWAAFNAVRIEAGRPLMGIDFDQTVLPAETGQVQFSRAVSLTKGCYLGQEIVARMHARGVIARQIVGIRMTGEELPVAGCPIYDPAGNVIGGITSSTVSPILSNASICLGMVKKAFIATGTELTIPAEGAMRKGNVADLPFVSRQN